jgi:thiosulfate reductase cytochrome b subunit
MSEKLLIFTRFERLWHWSQAGLIIGMLLTGFELHGSWVLFGYRRAAEIHVTCAAALMCVWVFAIFWHVVTGEWRQYVPTTRKLWTIIRFYTDGIFRGEPHPFRPSRGKKHNPLQLLAYLFFNAVVSPSIWISGLVLLGINLEGFDPGMSSRTVATIHGAAAWATAVFLVAHVYMITTGESVLQYLKAMITGTKTLHSKAPQSEGSEPSS